MSRAAGTSKGKQSKARQPVVTVTLFDLLNQALSEFIHAEHVSPQSYVDLVDQCILNKKQTPAAIDPVIFAFSPVSSPPKELFPKFAEHLKSRYIRNLASIFCSKPTEFWRFHSFMIKQALEYPEVFDFLCTLSNSAAENEPQVLATLFIKHAFPLYSKYLSDRKYLSPIISLIFANTESDEAARDARISQTLDCCPDDETQYLILAHSVTHEHIFSTKLCDLYASYVDRGLNTQEFQPYAVHILRCLLPINSELLPANLPRIQALLDDERPILQTALIHFLVDSNQEVLLSHIIEKTKSLDVLSLALHLVAELGQIPGPLLISLFKKIGEKNIESVCTERCIVESPIGQWQLGRLTNNWNSAAVNATVINHIQTLPLQQWDVEFALCKLLLKQPMDSTSAQIWQQLFSTLSPQFGELMRDEEMTELIFDIVGFYITATQDSELLEKLLPALEPVVTVAKERCKVAATKFLNHVAELSPKFKQIVNRIILV